MTHNNFIKYLLISIAFCTILLGLFNLFVSISSHINLMVFSIVFYSILSYIIFLMGQKSTQSRPGDYFLYIVVINVFIKLIASFLIVFLYVKIYQPQDKYFVIPFLTIYMIFTIFETYFLSLQAKSSK